MITAITTFKLAQPITREEAKRIFLSTAPNYQGVAGLLRKTYLLSQDGRVAGGVYLWETKAQAEAMYTDAWHAYVAQKYGTAPEVVYYDSPVIVDNEAERIASFD